MYKMTRKQEGSEQNNVYKLDRLSSSVDYYCIQKKSKTVIFWTPLCQGPHQTDILQTKHKLCPLAILGGHFKTFKKQFTISGTKRVKLLTICKSSGV